MLGSNPPPFCCMAIVVSLSPGYLSLKASHDPLFQVAQKTFGSREDPIIFCWEEPTGDTADSD